MIVILSGVSGSGKDTIRKILLENNANLISFPSYTTREQRKDEIDGVDYNFVNKETFVNMIEEGKFYEYSIHHENYYGTPKAIAEEELQNGKILLKDVDVNGTKQLKKIFPKGEIISIFLNIDKEEMIKRLKARGNLKNKHDLEIRLERYEYEISQIDFYDYVVDNYDVQQTVKKIEEIIETEQNK